MKGCLFLNKSHGEATLRRCPSWCKRKFIHPVTCQGNGDYSYVWVPLPQIRWSAALPPTLLDSRFDHDSCGVGFVATLRNQPSHEILTQALTALARLAHRGAIAADGKSSDGVGIMTAIPREFLLASTGLSLDPGQPLGWAWSFSLRNPARPAGAGAGAGRAEPRRARLASRAHPGRGSGRDCAFQHSRDPPSAGHGQNLPILSAACTWRASSSSAKRGGATAGYVCSLSSHSGVQGHVRRAPAGRVLS
jgi:hypothetical protein